MTRPENSPTSEITFRSGIPMTSFHHLWGGGFSWPRAESGQEFPPSCPPSRSTLSAGPRRAPPIGLLPARSFEEAARHGLMGPTRGVPKPKTQPLKMMPRKRTPSTPQKTQGWDPRLVLFLLLPLTSGRGGNPEPPKQQSTRLTRDTETWPGAPPHKVAHRLRRP